MTRQRDNRSDWADFSDKRKAAELAGAGDVYGHNRRCEACRIELSSVPDGGCQIKGCPYKPRIERKKPVQHEAHEMEHLAVLVDQAWWAPGFERIEARSPHDGENIRRWKEGATSGFPDVLLIIPAMPYTGRVLAALEMKTEANQPKRDPGEQWWLPSFDGASKHGVRRDQARKLRGLHGAGFNTYVAYGAAEAFSWLDEQAGPRPDVLPDEWLDTNHERL